MNTNSPRYSIIIPSYNGIKYLPTCIETIISQDYEDYELILSDDHSTDGSQEFLQSLNHPNIEIIYPPESMSMTEHWEWALSHAKGEWQIFVGQDDGLQPYFFQLADRLTEQAQEKGLRTIMSSRAYFFWQGCEYVYGDIAVGYYAENKTRVHNFKYQALKALLGLQDYFELPQMYTTAIFHKGLLDEARSKQEGKVFSCHPQDANLAAIACSLEKEYLKSYIPLGWVGSSPKSAGMATFSDVEKADKNNIKELEELRAEYKSKIKESKIQYHELAGDFSFGSLPIYFWQAFMSTPRLGTTLLNSVLKSKAFKVILFSAIKKGDSNKYLSTFESIININGISPKTIMLVTLLLSFPNGLWNMVQLFPRVIRKLSNKLVYKKSWDEGIEIDMLKVSLEIHDKLKNKNWI